MADSFFDKVMKSISKPVIPEKPKEEYFDRPVAFPDADATSEEIEEYIRTDNLKE